MYDWIIEADIHRVERALLMEIDESKLDVLRRRLEFLRNQLKPEIPRRR